MPALVVKICGSLDIQILHNLYFWHFPLSFVFPFEEFVGNVQQMVEFLLSSSMKSNNEQFNNSMLKRRMSENQLEFVSNYRQQPTSHFANPAEFYELDNAKQPPLISHSELTHPSRANNKKHTQTMSDFMPHAKRKSYQLFNNRILKDRMKNTATQFLCQSSKTQTDAATFRKMKHIFGPNLRINFMPLSLARADQCKNNWDNKNHKVVRKLRTQNSERNFEYKQICLTQNGWQNTLRSRDRNSSKVNLRGSTREGSENEGILNNFNRFCYTSNSEQFIEANEHEAAENTFFITGFKAPLMQTIDHFRIKSPTKKGKLQPNSKNFGKKTKIQIGLKELKERQLIKSMKKIAEFILS